MKTTKAQGRTEYEKTLIGIARKLPVERVAQVIDFTRFLEAQALVTEPKTEESEANIEAQELEWDRLFASDAGQSKMLELAQKALDEDDAGLTTEMRFDQDDNLMP